MANKFKKKILISPEQASSPVGLFFLELGAALYSVYNETEDYFLVVDDFCPDVFNLPRLQVKKELNPKVVKNVRSYIREEFFTNPLSRKLLLSYFSGSNDFELVDLYSKDFKNVYTFKIHEFLNMGYFIDSIIVEAYKAHFDINQLRNYLNMLISFSVKRADRCERPMPVNVSYAHDGSAFVIQATILINNFEGKIEFEEVLGELIKNSNFFDVTYNAKINKLTLSSVLFKDKTLSGLNAYFFTAFEKSYAIGDESESDQLQSEVHLALGGVEPIRYESGNEGMSEAEKLNLAKKFSQFIKYFRKNEKYPKNIELLKISDVEEYLTNYPRQELVENIDEEVKLYTLKLIKDESFAKGLDDYITKIASSNLDSQVEQIQKVLGGKTLDDVEEALIINGSPEEDGVNKVKGWVESNDSVTVVSGEDDPLSNDEKWSIKKAELVEKIKEEATRLKADGRNIIEEDIVRVVSQDLNVNENDVRILVSGIVSEVISSELVKNQKLEDAFAEKVLNRKSSSEAQEKLEAQVVRMKKVIDTLKKELLKYLNEKKTITSSQIVGESSQDTSQESMEVSDVNGNLKLKSSLIRAMEAIKLKERQLEKMKIDFEFNLNRKDQKITALELKNEELKLEYQQSRELSNEQRLKIVEDENKMLQSRLELANKKLNIVNENIDKRENDLIEKRDKEIETLKANLQIAQSVIERAKQEKMELDSKYQEERDAARKLKEERGSTGSVLSVKAELATKEAQLQSLAEEKKSLEEKFRSVAMDLKKTEQKLKFTVSQLESSNRKKDQASGAKSVDGYIKQLEQAKSRLSEAATEVADRRKEIHKLKQENALMTSKLNELERKLAIADKKVA